VAVDVREEPSVDDLDRARLQDFYDELERFRAVFAKAQALVAPMLGEDAGRLEAMGKAIRRLYGPAVEPLMTHVEQVLAQARRMTEPLPENPMHRALERRSGADRRRAERMQVGPAFRASTVPTAPAPLEAIPLPPPERRRGSSEVTLRTRALDGKAEARTGSSRAVTPPRPPSIPPLSLSAVRRELRDPAPEPEVRITWEDPGGWGVL
jgi:hypothetical protein